MATKTFQVIEDHDEHYSFKVTDRFLGGDFNAEFRIESQGLTIRLRSCEAVCISRADAEAIGSSIDAFQDLMAPSTLLNEVTIQNVQLALNNRLDGTTDISMIGRVDDTLYGVVFFDSNYIPFTLKTAQDLVVYTELSRTTPTLAATEALTFATEISKKQ